jgi:hypothetical protein
VGGAGRSGSREETIARWGELRLVHRGLTWSVFGWQATAEAVDLTLDQLLAWLEGPHPQRQVPV